MNDTKIKIDNEHIKAQIITKKTEHAFALAKVIAQACELLDYLEEKE